VATQEALRRSFGRWGCPGALRVDNGLPWGTPSGDLPSPLSLWAAGLGVLMHWNDPYCPEENGVVERSQGTSQRWVEPASCANFEELSRRMQQEDWIQREEYPSIGGQSRRQAYPGLLHSGRGYCLSWERLVWDLGAALRFLGRFQVPRKVSHRGQVSVYRRLLYAGTGYRGSWVYVRLDPQEVQWVISDVQGTELRRWPAPYLTQQAIVALAVTPP
jgi:hypothetical protein